MSAETPSGAGSSGSGETSRAAWSTLLVLLVLIVGGLMAHAVRASTAEGEHPAPDGEVDATNAIVFLVDDMSDFACEDASTYLRYSSRWLVDEGVCYDNASVATPVCCPARAQVLTGQLAHNNGVRSQIGAFDLRPTDTVQHDLGEAGITTLGVGKYLNGVRAQDFFGPEPLDNAFDEFHFWNSYQQGAGTFRLYDDQGRWFLPDSGLSSTETNGAYVGDFLERSLAADQPFFVYDALFAPHKQAARDRPADLPLPSARNADAPVPPFVFEPERAAGDKLPIFDYPAKETRTYYEALHDARVRALYDVDEQMAAIFQRLEDAGVLDETVVIFASDNGYTDRGQVNWDGKSIPYPSATDVPMLAYYPGGPRGTVDDRPVSLVDIAPTLYDTLDVTPGHLLDGHSLLGDHERDVVIGEFYHESNNLVVNESGAATAFLPSWKMIKLDRESYLEWYRPDGSILAREYYRDPGMLRNLLHPPYDAAPPPQRIRWLRQLMLSYASCRGTEESGSRRPCP